MDSIKALAVYLYFPLRDFVHILHICYKPWCVLLFRQIFLSDLKIGIKIFHIYPHNYNFWYASSLSTDTYFSVLWFSFWLKNICWLLRVCLLVWTWWLSFGLTKYFTFGFLRDICAGYRTLSWQVFFFFSLNTLKDVALLP